MAAGGTPDLCEGVADPWDPDIIEVMRQIDDDNPFRGVSVSHDQITKIEVQSQDDLLRCEGMLEKVDVRIS